MQPYSTAASLVRLFCLQLKTGYSLENVPSLPPSLPRSLENVGSGFLKQWLDADLQPESLSSLDVVPLQLVFVDLLQIVAAEFLVALTGLEQVIADNKDAMGNRQGGSLYASPCGQRLNCAAK
jgi:hypothetical protein